MVKVQNWPVKDLDPGRGWIHCVYGSDHPLWICAVMQAHLATSVGLSGHGLREHRIPNCFSTLNQLKKPMEVGRCACITAQL